MSKKLLLIIGIILVFVSFFLWHKDQPQEMLADDYKNATYEIDGKMVELFSGEAETGSVITRYFGNNAKGDLNGDGVPDLAFILTQDGGGSGTFYYIVVALQIDNKYQGTNAVLLGDRIAPQTTEIKDGELIVNYADRKQDEPMSAQPSVGISKYLKIVNGRLEDKM